MHVEVKDGQSRRSFMVHGVTGLMAASLATPTLAGSAATSPKKENDTLMAYDPRAKLKAISPREKQLWTVVYVEADKTREIVERDVEASLEGGADAVVLEIGKNVPALTLAVQHVRNKYGHAKVGVNYLGDDQDPYGYLNGFRLAKEFELDIVWTDFSGVDLVKEVPEISLHTIEAHRAPNAFYCSGVHMKYGTLLDPGKLIERSAQQAMGWVDGVIITGPRTGVPTDPERARRTRGAIGAYPLGAASGVSAENFDAIRDAIDFCLVNTSIATPEHRIVAAKVRSLRQVMG